MEKGGSGSLDEQHKEAGRGSATGTPLPPGSGFWHMVGRGLYESWSISAAIVWMELVFKLSTTGGLFPGIFFILLFSTSLGLLLWFATSFIPRLKHRRVVVAILLALLGVLFCVEYFVFCEFKVFYDLNTILNGAGGVAGQFGGDAASLVFSPSGLLHVLLFLAPAILYVVLWRTRKLSRKRPTRRARWVSGVGMVLAYLLAVGLLALPTAYGKTYFSRYSFQAAVGNFGLVTGLRKDVWKAATSSGGATFEDEGALDAGSTSDGGSSSAQAYDKNVMDIDFASLDQSDENLVSLDEYVSSLTPSSQNEMTGRCADYNLIFISAEAFCAEVIDPELTPTLYRLANNGIQFTDYYQPASCGTTGGEVNNIMGVLPVEGGNSMDYLSDNNNYFTMGSALNREGYNGWMFHNNDYTFYDRNVTHEHLGYNNGFMGMGNGMEEYVTQQWTESDLEMVQGTFENIYADQEPFNVYYMTVSGHGVYTDANAMSAKNWDKVADLDYNDEIKHYLAAQMEFESAMEWLVNALEERHMADHTLIVISADHFPYGIDTSATPGNIPNLSELYGYDVETYWQRDHNRLIMWSESFEDEDPIVVDTPTFSDDVLPTLLNLFGLEYDSRLLPGRDVFSDATPLAFDVMYNWKTSLGTYNANSGTFTPASDDVEVPDGYVDSMNAIVHNKIQFCYGVIDRDYYGHVFGAMPDVQAEHDAAAENARRIAEKDAELEAAAETADSARSVLEDAASDAAGSDTGGSGG